MIVTYDELDKKERISFRKLYKKMYAERKMTRLEIIESINDDIDDCFDILLYKLDGKVVGCVYITDYDYFVDKYFKDGCFYISNLYVDEKYRNMGIATKLLKKAQNMAIEEGIKYIVSDYVEDNEISAKWHDKNGFSVIDKKISVIKKI